MAGGIVAVEASSVELHTRVASARSSAHETLFTEGDNTQFEAQNEFPEGGARAWLVVLGSFCCVFSTWGLVNSIGIFQAYWERNQLSQYSSSDIGWIGGVNTFLNFFLGVQIGPLFDSYGPRWLLLGGSIGHVVALFLLAQCTKYYQFMLSYGVLAGICSACLTTSAVSVIAHWFNVRRGQASGICFIGSSVGGVIFPLTLQPMLDRFGWTWTVRIVAFVILGVLTVANFCIRGRLPTKRTGGTIELRAFADARFSWATVGIATFEYVLVSAIGLLPTIVIYSGFNTQTSFYVIAVLNGCSAIGRYTSGLIADNYGRFNAMIITLLISAVAVLAFGVPIGDRVPLLYIFAVVFGFGSGSVISLAPVCFGQLCSAAQYGRYYGTGYSVVSFAILISIPTAGALLPAIGAQGLLAFFGGVLGLSLICFSMARFAMLENTWKWRIVV